jgi:hypothetical protein
MKFFMLLWALTNFMSCSTKKVNSENWDSGAQKQEAIKDESYQQREENTRNQFPEATEILNRPQPF